MSALRDYVQWLDRPIANGQVGHSIAAGDSTVGYPTIPVDRVGGLRTERRRRA